MAFLNVLVFHILNLNSEWVPWLVGGGKIGVWLFFVLSSFLLTYYFVDRPERITDPLEWGNYLVRRCLRIYPLYAAVLLIYWFNEYVITNVDILQNHLLLHEGFIHFWTMPVELKYYLILPLLVVLLVLVLRNRPLLALLFAIVFIGIHQQIYPGSKVTPNTLNVLVYLPVFVMGACAAVLHHHLSKRRLADKTRLLLDVVALLILVASYLPVPAIRFALFGIERSDDLLTKHVYYGIGWSLFILCVLHGGELFKRIFNTRLFGFLGRISFPAYLIHWLIMVLVVNYFEELNVKSALVIVVCTFVSSYLLHLLVEKPLSKIQILSLRNTGAKRKELSN